MADGDVLHGVLHGEQAFVRFSTPRRQTLAHLEWGTIIDCTRCERQAAGQKDASRPLQLATPSMPQLLQAGTEAIDVARFLHVLR